MNILPLNMFFCFFVRAVLIKKHQGSEFIIYAQCLIKMQGGVFFEFSFQISFISCTFFFVIICFGRIISDIFLRRYCWLLSEHKAESVEHPVSIGHTT